jgi:hypothetical protein
MPKRRIDRRMLPALRHYAKRLYMAAGHDPKAPGSTVSLMASTVRGEGMSQGQAYIWLAESYTPGLTDLPSVKRRVRRQLDTFYDSPEWRELRYQALAQSDGSCSLCGRSKRDHGVILHVDHIEPRSVAPARALDITNLQVLCEDCNMGKGNRDARDWRADTFRNRV